MGVRSKGDVPEKEELSLCIHKIDVKNEKKIGKNMKSFHEHVGLGVYVGEISTCGIIYVRVHVRKC